MFVSCSDWGNTEVSDSLISSDRALFAHITMADPISSYLLFPRADSIVSGSLNGSTAHHPLVRVTLNAEAFGTLRAGTLPPGSRFPNGSVFLKEIIIDGKVSLYAVLFKDDTNPHAAGGWLWAEFHTDGTSAVSITSNGSGCVSCHSREQGEFHDLIRTFERQKQYE